MGNAHWRPNPHRSSEPGMHRFHRPHRQRAAVFYGWWIVAAASFYNFLISGTFYIGFTAFFDPLRHHFGWSSAQTAMGVSLQRLESSIAAPLVGYLYDRVGPRKLILPGMLVAGGGLILMGNIQSLAGYYTAFLITAVGLSVAWLGPPMYTVSNWFIKKRSRALAILMAGSSFGGLLVPAVVYLIASTGWRFSLMAIGIVYCVVSAPLTLMLKHRPEVYGLRPDGDSPEGEQTPSGGVAEKAKADFKTGAFGAEINFHLKQAIKTGAFWLIALSLTLSQFVMTAVYVLEMPHFENIGVSREVAGVTVTFTTLLALVGSLIGGFLGDFIEKRHLLAIAIALQSLGLLIMATLHHTWQIVPFVLIYGIGFGATVPLRPAIIADYFGRSNIGTITGFVMSIILLGSVLSPLAAGWFYDAFESYRGIFVIYAILLMAGAPAVLAARRPALK